MPKWSLNVVPSSIKLTRHQSWNTEAMYRIRYQAEAIITALVSTGVSVFHNTDTSKGSVLERV